MASFFYCKVCQRAHHSYEDCVPTNERPFSFMIGDKVALAKDCSWGKKGRTMLIHEVSYQGGGYFHYDTSLGAWLDHEQLVLVAPACKEAFEQLDREIEEEQGYCLPDRETQL